MWIVKFINTYPIFLFAHEWTLSLAYAEVNSLRVDEFLWILDIRVELVMRIQNIVHWIMIRSHALRIPLEREWHWHTFLVDWVCVWVWIDHFEVHNLWLSTEELLIELVLLVLIYVHNWSGWYRCLLLKIGIELPHVQFHWFEVFLVFN